MLIRSKHSKISFGYRKLNFLHRKQNYFTHFQSSDQKILQKHYVHLIQGLQNKLKIISKQEMELSEEEMELYFHFQTSNQKHSSGSCSYDPRISSFRNRKWNYLNMKWNFLNRKWNYFTHFQSCEKNFFRNIMFI